MGFTYSCHCDCSIWFMYFELISWLFNIARSLVMLILGIILLYLIVLRIRFQFGPRGNMNM
jgi:hypothetical protein